MPSGVSFSFSIRARFTTNPDAISVTTDPTINHRARTNITAGYMPTEVSFQSHVLAKQIRCDASPSLTLTTVSAIFSIRGERAGTREIVYGHARSASYLSPRWASLPAENAGQGGGTPGGTPLKFPMLAESGNLVPRRSRILGGHDASRSSYEDYESNVLRVLPRMVSILVRRSAMSRSAPVCFGW